MDNFNDVRLANASVIAQERKARAAQEARQRRTIARLNTLAIKDGMRIAGRVWHQFFKAPPAHAVTVVRTRSLIAHKAGTNAAHAYAHNLRTNTTNAAHIDPSRTPQNLLIHQQLNDDGTPTLPEDILSKYRARGLLSSRSNAEAVELLFAISGDLWDELDPAKRPEFLRAFGDEIKAFLTTGNWRYGRLLQVVVHQDEIDAKPNVKAIFLPLVAANVRAFKKGEGPRPWVRQEVDPQTGAPVFNEDGTPKMGRVVEVSKGKFKIDTKQGLSNLQTQFANHLRQRGWHVQRGEVREPEQHQKHKTTREWKAEQERLAREVQKRLMDEGREVAESLVNDAEIDAQNIIQQAQQEAKKINEAAQKKAQTMLKDLTLTAREEFLKRQAERDKLAAYVNEKNQPKAAPEFVSRERAEREKRAQALRESSEQLAKSIENPAQKNTHKEGKKWGMN